jgi:hypothetical protein
MLRGTTSESLNGLLLGCIFTDIRSAILVSLVDNRSVVVQSRLVERSMYFPGRKCLRIGQVMGQQRHTVSADQVFGFNRVKH